MHKTLVALVGCLLFAGGCDAWLTKPSLYSVVETIVTDPNGAPVPGADLTLYTGQRPMAYAKTGADGRYRFERVPQGFYGVFVTRPAPYRDFNSPGDSMYTYRDGIQIAGGLPDTVRFVVSSCAGVVDAIVEDEAGAPVAGAKVDLYTSTFPIATLATDAAGTATFSRVRCAYGLGVLVHPPTGYSVTQGRGSSFYDGFMATNGSRQTVTFQLQKTK